MDSTFRVINRCAPAAKGIDDRSAIAVGIVNHRRPLAERVYLCANAPRGVIYRRYPLAQRIDAADGPTVCVEDGSRRVAKRVREQLSATSRVVTDSRPVAEWINGRD